MNIRTSNRRRCSWDATRPRALLLVMAGAIAALLLAVRDSPAQAQPDTRATPVNWWVKATCDLIRSTSYPETNDLFKVALLKVTTPEVEELRALLESSGPSWARQYLLSNYAPVKGNVADIAGCQVLVVGHRINSRFLKSMLVELASTNILTVGWEMQQFTGLPGGMVALYSQTEPICEINSRNFRTNLALRDSDLSALTNSGIRVIKK